GLAFRPISVAPACSRVASPRPLLLWPGPRTRVWTGRLSAGAWLDVVLIGTLTILAGVVRWPNLLLSPQFPSGGEGIVMALAVADGHALYLREVSPYIGTPYLYLLALVFRVVGSSVEATLLLSWAMGTLTIVPIYLLGREVGGRMVGCVAATLLAMSAAH